MAYDTGQRRTLLFGGRHYAGRCAGTGGQSGRYLHAMAYDAARAQMVMYGGFGSHSSEGTWLYRAPTQHARRAAHLIALPLPAGAALEALAVSHTSAARGAAAAVATAGLDLMLWNGSSASWAHLGEHIALDTDDAASRTIAVSPAAPLGDYLGFDRIWLMAVASEPSSPPPGTVASEVRTDYVEVQVNYLLP